MHAKQWSVGAMLSIVGIGAPLAQAVVVDDFDVSPTNVNLTVNAGGPLQMFRDNIAGVLGGQRDGFIEYLGSSVPGNQATLRIDSGDSNLLSHSQDNGVTARTTIIWDGSADAGLPNVLDPTGLGGISLLSDGSLSFQFNIISADVNGILRMQVYTDANNWSITSYSFPGQINNSAVHLPFANFVMGGGASGAADFNNVGAIVLIIDGSTVASLDVAIDLLDTARGIPEPMTAGLSILALGALAGTVARRQRA